MRFLALALVLAVTALAGGSAPASSAAPAAPGSAAPAVPGGVQAGPSVRSDTLRARPGDRLVLRNVAGRVHVRGVEGDLVRALPSSPPDEGGVVLSRSGDRIRLSHRGRGDRSRERDLVIEAPVWLALDLRSDELEVTVEGLGADVSVRNVDGDLEVRDVEGTVTLWSVDGEIRITDVRGAVSARSVDGSIDVARVTGDVEVGSTDGDLRLVDVDAGRVDAQTVDGDIGFDGPLRAGGTYALVTHGGDVTAAIQEGVGVRVEVSTFDGSFEAAFPVTLERFRGGREMSFTLGDGGARLVLQAFDGDIRLRHRR